MPVGGCVSAGGAAAGPGWVQEKETPIRPLLSLPLRRSLLTNVRRRRGRGGGKERRGKGTTLLPLSD